MLEVMRDHFNFDTIAMHREIQSIHIEVQDALSAKGLNYESTKAALVPSTDKNEAGFIFNSQDIESSWYGGAVAKAILPLLDKRTTQSVLLGDLLGKDQEFILQVLQEHMVLARSFEFVHGTLLYCVYINNLSDAALLHLHTELLTFQPYLGFIPATYQTLGKTYLSTTLVNSFLKVGTQVIMSHEDDRSNDEDVNMSGYPFADFGYRVKSLQSSLFGMFLSYKVERAVYSGFEVDTEMSLNSVSEYVLPLTDCTIQIEEAKFEYLKSKKSGLLQKAGVAELSRETLEKLIITKIAGSYIYNMTFLQEHNVVKFNLMVEIPQPHSRYPTRLVAALEYKPQDKLLRLITLT
jgi:hypothetical protein